MIINRREFSGAAALILVAGCAGTLKGAKRVEEAYGLIGEMIAAPGKRAELIAILAAGTRDMPGNIAYLIAEDLANPDSIWITEVWSTRTDHANSLKLPAVQAAIASARPLLGGFGKRIETRPLIID